ncbi:ATP-binding protein [Dyadobacter sp. CY312]|uniref:ligand-binding sensor domain-containing protein n=1 Tax=Dyadobacter sp. CY312 TaxID=2907303 RepID=UPI001F217DC6|nr:ATP-binding protein [Dyadobacter sp. CY312]MCE7044214.1 ATP-binding protein [Dyadobacter sp. CY312]
MNRFFLITCSFLWLGSNYVCAQTALLEKYSIVRYTDVNGLPQNSVKSIAAGAAGFVWLVTEGGLVRFDGRQFETYNKFNLGIGDNRFYAIFPSWQMEGETNTGSRLYAATDQGDFIKVENGKAVYDPKYSREKGTSSLLFRQKHIVGSFITGGLPIIQDQNLPSIKRYMIPVGGREGNFYVCDSTKITLFKGWKKHHTTYLKSTAIWHYFLMNGKLYHYNPTGSITGIDPGGANQYEFTGDITLDKDHSNGGKRMKLFWNNANDQAFLYLNKNLYILDASKKKQISTKLLLRDFDLDSRNIKTLYYNNQDKSLFMGSVTQGLFLLKKQPFAAVTTTGSEAENVFYAQTTYGKDGILVPQGIAFKSALDGGMRTQKRLPSPFKENSADNRGILTDRSGAKWVKNYHYLSRYDPTGHKQLNKWDLKDEIKTIYTAGDNVVWIGLKKKGLFMAVAAAEAATPEPFLAGLPDVSFIETKTSQILLVGTEHGLYEVDLSKKKARLVSGTNNMFIKSIYVASPDQVWITAQDLGILLLKNGTLVTFPLDDKKYLAASHCIIEDENGFFWVTTNKGLFRINKNDLLAFAEQQLRGKESNKEIADLYYEYHDQNEGFLINEFNGGCQPCALKLEDGLISLPSLKGLIWFKPKDIPTYSLRGGIFLDRTVVDGKLLSITDTLALTESSRRIKLSFSTPYYGNSENLHLSYALIEKGTRLNNSDWVAIDGRDFSVYFSSLNAGNYTLLIKKLNGFGAKNHSIKSITITVPPLWHQTWWSRAAFLLAFVVCTLLLFKVRENRIKHEKRLLESKVALRTSELETSMDEQARQLLIMSRLLTSISHDIHSPLNFINRASKYVPKLISKGEFQDASELADSINESTQSMGALLTGLLDYLKAYLYGKSMTFEQVNLDRLIDEKLLVFRSFIDSKKNTVNRHIPVSISVFSDYQMLSIIVHNLIDNASKFTEKGEINIKAYHLAGKVHLVIANNGQPLSNDLIEVFNNGKHLENNQGIGLGFFLIKQIADLINVEVLVKQNERTEFHLFFETQL